MTPRPAVAAFAAAARRLGDHPHDDGWRDLYRLFAFGLTGQRAPRLAQLVQTAQARKRGSTDEHLVTLVGIAVRSLAGPAIAELTCASPVPGRLGRLEQLLSGHQQVLEQVIARRQNSFTGARRFLLPQILLAAYFAGRDQPARIADLGTGLGVLPRQLNARDLFQRFARDLVWPDRQPAYRSIPIGGRYGVDRGPLPDLSWVRSCYGPSDYYDDRFRELVEVLSHREVRAAQVEYAAVDLTDPAALRAFLLARRINAVNLSYLLYQLAPATRAEILAVLATTLAAPGLVIVTEPRRQLAAPGCVTTVHDQAHPEPRPVCSVSHGHFRGKVTLLDGFQEFTRAYPVMFDEALTPTGAVDVAPPDHAA